MISGYQNLIDNFKRTLRIFRFRLLLFSMVKGVVILLFSLLFLLLCYFCLSALFQWTILGKTVYFYFFILVFSVLFIRFLFYPFFCFLFLENPGSKRLLSLITSFSSDKQDVLVSVYHFAFHGDLISGDEQLKQAAFIQKINYLNEHRLGVILPWRMFFKPVFLFFILLVALISFSRPLNGIWEDLKNYEIVRSRYTLQFSLQNPHLNVEYGKGLKLLLKVENSDYKVERVFICYGGGEFLMSREDSLFTYRFETLNNDINFYFKALEQQSEGYKINVLPVPLITSCQVTSMPPAYTGLKPEVQKNTVDFRVLYGSRLKFELNLRDVDSLFLLNKDNSTVIPLKTKNSAEVSLNVNLSGEYSLSGSNQYFKNKNLLDFTITSVLDLYPGIQVSEVNDSLSNSIRYFYGVITDDFGFSALRFTYSVNGHTNTVVPIPIIKNKNTQEFYFTFDFAEFAGMDKSEINYYFEIFDNDVISGPKSTRSDGQKYVIPDLNTIFDYNVEASTTVNSALKDAEKLAKEIVSGVKELQHKMLDNTVDNWEKQQLSKDIIQKKEKLDKLLNTVKEADFKKSALNKNFTSQDSVLIDKQKQIQDLLDHVMNDEVKKLMEEFAKLSEEFSKDKFKSLDEKMKLTFDQISEELDRNIELLKRFQIEEQHDLVSQQLDQLKEKQEELNRMMNDQSFSKDSLSAKSKQLKEGIEKINQNYQELLKKNKELTEPYSLKDFNSDFEKLEEKIREQDSGYQEGKKNEKLSDEIKKELNELSDKIKQQQEQNFVNNSLPQNDIELIIQNILIISLSEEELLKEFPKVETQSLRYNELGRLQDLKRQEYKIVKDSLSVLAKSNLMLASLLSGKFYDIEIKFGLLPGYIQDNKRSDLFREQQYIISYLNDIALSLTEALQKDRQNSSSSGKGKGDKKGSESGKEKSDSSEGEGKDYQQMKQYQNNLKKQLEQLISQMKKGENGKPLQQGISNIIRENELFRKSLNDFISHSGSLSNTEKQILNEINQLIEENIRDLANYSVTNQIINRNNLIYNKLLISEKASKEKEEFEEKRKSQSASEAKYQRPENIFKNNKKAGLIQTDFQKSDLKLNDYYKNMYNNYYIKLGNE